MIHNGYRFFRQRFRERQHRYDWACTNNKKYSCRARIMQDSETGHFLINKNKKIEHTHAIYDKKKSSNHLIATVKPEYSTTAFGKLCLLYMGHRFKKNHVKNKTVYWHCVMDRKMKCPSRINQDSETHLIDISNFVEHNHDILPKGKPGRKTVNFMNDSCNKVQTQDKIIDNVELTQISNTAQSVPIID